MSMPSVTVARSPPRAANSWSKSHRTRSGGQYPIKNPQLCSTTGAHSTQTQSLTRTTSGHVSADIRDAEVAAAARRGELRGWSFGFSVKPGGELWDDTANPYPRRALTSIDLAEVSLIDSAMTPAYRYVGRNARRDRHRETRYRG